jgi:UDP-N-acetylglucosamine pyrophosphorylase
MKKIIFIIYFILIGFIAETQVKKTTDTTQLCLPYNVAQKILLELNDYDKLKELSKLDKEEINELNNKINLLEKTNNVWSEKDSLSDRIIKSNEEKFNIVETENKNLRKENKRLKTKNGLFNIISVAIIVPLTYLLIIK